MAQQQIRSYSVIADGALELVLALSSDTITVRDIAREGGSLEWRAEFAPTRDTVVLWPSDTTLRTQGAYEISLNGAAIDTLRYRPTKRMPFHTGLVATLVERESGSSVLISAARPIASFDTTRITLRKDSLTLPFGSEQVDARTLQLTFQSTPGAPIQLLVQPKAVRDIYGVAMMSRVMNGLLNNIR